MTRMGGGVDVMVTVCDKVPCPLVFWCETLYDRLYFYDEVEGETYTSMRRISLLTSLNTRR